MLVESERELRVGICGLLMAEAVATRGAERKYTKHKKYREIKFGLMA